MVDNLIYDCYYGGVDLVRIADFPFVSEVKDEYLSLRRGGNNRDTAIQKLQYLYANELQEDDDAMLFWIGLANAQVVYKEITSEIADKAMCALELLEKTDWHVSSQDISRYKRKYSCAPMPEKKTFRTPKKFCCQWEIGDTYAYQIQTASAKTPELIGKYALIHKVADVELWDGRMVPVVTLSIWPSRPFPQTVQEFEIVPILKLNVGKKGMQPGQVEYRTAMTIKSKKQLDALSLEYVGNFDVQLPKNEMVYTNVAYMSMTLPEYFSRDICSAWIKHQGITERGL